MYFAKIVFVIFDQFGLLGEKAKKAKSENCFLYFCIKQNSECVNCCQMFIAFTKKVFCVVLSIRKKVFSSAE